MSSQTMVAPILTDRQLRNKQTLETLRKNGLFVFEYSRGPLGPRVFSLSLGSNSEYFHLWFGDAIIDIVDVTDGDTPQAVLHVIEEDRDITVTQGMDVFPRYRYRINGTPDMFESEADALKQTSKARPKISELNVIFPDTAKVKDAGDWKVAKFGHRRSRVTRSVTVNIPPSSTYFLIGFDEKKCFACILPREAKSVADAHRILRPAGLRPNAVRQGEWFFEPVANAKMNAEIEETYQRNSRTNYQIRIARPLEPSSTHQAVRFNYNNTLYAKGVVKDTRTSRHADLDLGERWHRVVRNREVVAPRSRTTSRRSRAQRWD